ncbi:MAG TPA: glycosyltransferase, partial [Ideonella sp.]|nr:glycosyltransferase [Ideonella sp.]
MTVSESLMAPAHAPDPYELAARHGIGAVDQVSEACVSGWAWDPQDPDANVLVDILDGEMLLATVRADLSRPDLQELGMGHGRHGFAIALGPGVLPMAEHLVRVRRHEDKAELHQSPWRLQRDDAALDDAGRDRLARWVAAECAWARCPADLDTSLSLLARLLGDVMARHADLQARDVTGSAQPDFASLADAATPSQWVAAAGQALSQAYPAPALPPVAQPVVSIIIPVFNQFALTHACLRSIAQNMPEIAFEVIVVDDASTDETLLAPLLWQHSVRVVRQDVNRGFVHACNRGAAAAQGELLCFLNNDTLVQPGWLDALADTFAADPRIGVAGAKLLNADGTLQECGGLVWRLGDAWNWGRGEDPEGPAYAYLRDVDYVS